MVRGSIQTANGYCAKVLAELAMDLMADDAPPEFFNAASKLLHRASIEASQAESLGRILRPQNPEDDPPF